MSIAKNWSEIEKLIMQKVARAMDSDHLGKDVKETVQKHIRDDVYGKYHPENYQTTGEFHDSVISKNPDVVGNSVEISIEHDPNLMNMKEPWYHQSVLNGEDIREALPQIIEEGLTYNLWGHDESTAYLQPRPYMQNAEDELLSTKKHVKKLAQYLREQGLNVKE